jgi:hypothetical protein
MLNNKITYIIEKFTTVIEENDCNKLGNAFLNTIQDSKKSIRVLDYQLNLLNDFTINFDMIIKNTNYINNNSFSIENIANFLSSVNTCILDLNLSIQTIDLIFNEILKFNSYFIKHYCIDNICGYKHFMDIYSEYTNILISVKNT